MARGTLIVAFALALSACGGKDKTPPTVVKGSLQASADLNPDIRGRPSPLLLRIYELKSTSTFMNSDFYSLFDKDEQLLGADVQGREELSILPGETKNFERQLKADSKFIAVFGAYRDVERAGWRAVMPIAPAKTTQVTINANRRAVAITGKEEAAKRKLWPF
jgi:type VI secretion system protein VasD